jgi:phosphoribosyl-ATP pyrophosphohydrolase
MTDPIERLYAAVIAARYADPEDSRTARLMQAGRAKMAKKVAEEAIEVVLDAMHGRTDAVVRESADLIYNLVVLWAAAGIRPEEVWVEMDRRERLFGIAEKLRKPAAIKGGKARGDKANGDKDAETEARATAEVRELKRRAGRRR